MPANKPVRHITPNQSFSDWLLQLRERRETLWFFIWKDLKVQYSKPIFGLIWSVFQPLVYFGIILLVMQFSGRQTATTGMPFEVYLIAGLAVWNFCTSAILGSINSIQSNAGIISKSFFPRFYLVLAPMLKSSIDLLIMLLITVGIAAWYGQQMVLQSITLLPTMLFLLWITTMGWAAIATSATIMNRHFRHAIPVLLYAMLFALPIFYSVSEMDNSVLKTIYTLNPISGSMDFLRASFGATIPPLNTTIVWLLQSLAWCAIGLLFFRKVEKSLADKI